MKSMPRAILVPLLFSSMLIQSCVIPPLCSQIDHTPQRPASIAQPPDLILLTQEPLFKEIARNRRPSWSPDGRELVFEHEPNAVTDTGGLYIVRADGSHATRIWPGHLWTPAWGPTDGWIACQFYDGQTKTELVLLHRDGQRSRRVGGQGTYPSWSPDGRHLVYQRTQSTSDRDLYLADLVEEYQVRPLLEGPTDDRDPAWSPDGSRIAFSSNRDGAYNIYVMPAPQEQASVDLTQIIQITHVVSDSGRAMKQPTWSPDSSQIAFVCTASPYSLVGQLYVVSVAGGEPTLLFDTEIDMCSEPAWSPDGQWLAFSYGGQDPTGPLGSDIYLLRMKQ